MNRRGFLGSTIGTILASQLPFVARRPGPLCVLPKNLVGDAMADLFSMSNEELLRHEMFYETDGGRVAAPPLERVDVDRANRRISFVVQEWRATQPILVFRLGLKSPGYTGHVLSISDFRGIGAAYLVGGDTLRGTLVVEPKDYFGTAIGGASQSGVVA